MSFPIIFSTHAEISLSQEECRNTFAVITLTIPKPTRSWDKHVQLYELEKNDDLSLDKQ